MSAQETWYDGELRSTRLSVNGFPDDHDEAVIPDEVFLDTKTGRVDMYRKGDEWVLSLPGHPDDRSTFGYFETAFAHALLCVRREVEQ